MPEYHEDTIEHESDMGALELTVKADTSDAIDDFRELREVVDETRAAVESLEDALRSFGKTTTGPEGDLKEFADDIRSTNFD